MSRRHLPRHRSRRPRAAWSAVALALALQCGLAAAARANGIFLDPPITPELPSAGEPITVAMAFAPCPGNGVTVVRRDPVIEIDLVDGVCTGGPPPAIRSVALGTLPAGAYDLRLVDVTNPGTPVLDDEAVIGVLPPACDSDELCLLAGRFGVKVTWQTKDGQSGGGKPVPMSDESGAFWFFDEHNLEVMIKVLDGCAVNGHYWVYAGGLTDVEVTLHVRDRAFPLGPLGTGHQHDYASPPGPFTPVDDTGTFACAAPP